MAHKITPDEHYSEDESAVWAFTIEEDGSAKDIGGATLEWYLLKSKNDDPADAIYDYNDSGIDVSLTTDGSDGRIDLTIDQDIIEADIYYQLLVVDDSGSSKQKWKGKFPVEK